MNIELRKNLPYYKAIISLSVLTLISGILVAFLGELMLPIAAACYAALLLYESRDKSKRLFSLITPVAVIVANILLGSYIPVIAVEIVLIALVIFFTFSRGIQKNEAVFAVTAIVVIMTIVGFIVSPMIAAGSYTWETVTAFYAELYETLKSAFIDYIENMIKTLSSTAISYTTEEIALIFDSAVSMLVSVIFIVAFLISGVTFKLFSYVMYKSSDKPEEVLKWRFTTSSIFAYAAMAVIILAALVRVESDMLYITLQNLSNIFMAIYAYIGFNFVNAIISSRWHGRFSFLLLLMIILFFANIVIQLLAVVGIFFTINQNKILKFSGDNNGDDNTKH